MSGLHTGVHPERYERPHRGPFKQKPENQKGACMSVTIVYSTTMPSPVGELYLSATAQGLSAVMFIAETNAMQRYLRRHRVSPFLPDARPILDAARAYLEAYFAGEKPALTFPLDLQGTAFQRSVWQALLTIPYGETRAYSEIAAQIGRPKAVRAVGQAVGANPVSIIVPCHRVVGRNGDLTGYGGGLSIKRALLDLERGVYEPALPA